MWRDHLSHSTQPVESPAPASHPLERGPDDTSFDLDFCHMTDLYSPREEILLIANWPAGLVTDWRNPCPSLWSISGMMISTTWQRPTPASLAKQRYVDLIFLLLIGIQWLFIGGFPLRSQLGLWRDPATLVTLFTVASAALSLIPGIESLATFPSLFAAIAWLWWFVLLAWKLLRSVWNWIADRRRERVPGISA